MIAVSAVELTIVQPRNGAGFYRGESQVRMVGRVESLPAELVGVSLYYRWYSNLLPSQENRYSINANALSDPSVPFDAPLGVGTHVIILAAGDRSGETKSDQNATRHGGVAGGAKGDKQCIIHLFKATPKLPSTTLNKAGSVLAAEAPIQWGRKIGNTNSFEPNPDYHGINRIRYRWHFEPNPRDGRAAADLVPSVETLTFVPPGEVPLVRYEGPLPDVLDTGNYTLTLRVEDKNDPTVGHETSLAVVVS